MKRSSAKSLDDMSSQDESSTESLESLESEIPRTGPKVELDYEDREQLLVDAYYTLGLVADLRMKASLRQDVLKLLRRIEESMSWYKQN